MKRQPPGIRPPARPAAGTAAISAGPNILVTEAPTLPAPKVPSARPWRLFGNHTEFQAMPAVNELPAMPTRNAQIMSMVKEVEMPTRKEAAAEASSRPVNTLRPPTRSVMMPKARRQIEPLSTAIAPSQ